MTELAARFIERCKRVLAKISPTPDGRGIVMLPKPCEDEEREAFRRFVQEVAQGDIFPLVRNGNKVLSIDPS
jgi:hypothetical protein